MESLSNLSKGLEVLKPFLKRHAFEFANFENGKDSVGEYIVGTFKNHRKKFLVDYRFSIGQILYQFDNSIVGHQFYLNHLGFSDKMKLTDFLSDNKPEAFQYVLHDLDFLVDDFFAGECKKLVEFTKLQDNIIYELDKNIRQENSIIGDNFRIDKARIEFRNKDFVKSLEIYNAIRNKNLLNDLDRKIIEFGERKLSNM